MEGDCPRLECVVVIYRISIHSLRMEGDIVFYRIFPSCQHFNPLPPHGGRRRFSMWMPNPHIISIHSLRMEGDAVSFEPYRRTAISIHSLRMEGDRIAQLETDLAKAFQSTPSAWRETHQVLVLFCRQFHFNPLPPHGGRRTAGRLKNALKSFQSTPSAWRETFFSSNNGCYSIHFNPLPPHGGRLQILACNWEIQFISIHSLRMEGDSILPGGWKAMNHFNPLPPHGGRLPPIHQRQ